MATLTSVGHPSTSIIDSISYFGLNLIQVCFQKWTWMRGLGRSFACTATVLVREDWSTTHHSIERSYDHSYHPIPRSHKNLCPTHWNGLYFLFYQDLNSNAVASQSELGESFAGNQSTIIQSFVKPKDRNEEPLDMSVKKDLSPRPDLKWSKSTKRLMDPCSLKFEHSPILPLYWGWHCSPSVRKLHSTLRLWMLIWLWSYLQITGMMNMYNVEIKDQLMISLWLHLMLYYVIYVVIFVRKRIKINTKTS